MDIVTPGVRGRVWSAVMDDPATIGARVRRTRVSRRLSQREVAGLAGISAAYLSQLENGVRPLDSTNLISRIADALQVSFAELTALPTPAPGNGAVSAAVEGVRHALAAVGYGDPGGMVVPVDVLRGQVAQLRRARRHCEFAIVGEALPGLIRNLHTTLDAGRSAELLALAVEVHVHLTYMWLRDAGASTDLRREVARVARAAAQELDDPAVLAMSTFGSAKALLDAGMVGLAQAFLSANPLPPATPGAVGVLGTLLMKHADVAAAAGRAGDVAAPMEAAAELAHRVDDHVRDPLGFGFTLGIFDLRRASLALESGEADRAVSIAERIQPARLPFVTSQSAYWVVTGRALARLRGRRADAVRAFRMAEQMFPIRVQRDPLAREGISAMIERARREAITPEARELALRIGLPLRK